MPIDAGSVAVAKGPGSGICRRIRSSIRPTRSWTRRSWRLRNCTICRTRLRELEHDMAQSQGEELEKDPGEVSGCQHEFELAGGYAWRHRAGGDAAGRGVGRSRRGSRRVPTLSGGQRSRLALAKLLIEPSRICCCWMSRPITWIWRRSRGWRNIWRIFSGAVLIVSHDRYLLDRLATRIVWLTGSQLRSYPGNYSAFVEQRQLQELTQQRAYEEQQADIEKQKEFIRPIRRRPAQQGGQGAGKTAQPVAGQRSDDPAAVGTTQKIRLSLEPISGRAIRCCR